MLACSSNQSITFNQSIKALVHSFKPLHSPTTVTHSFITSNRFPAMAAPSENNNNTKKQVRVWTDGCFDMMHYGHANALRQVGLSSKNELSETLACIGVLLRIFRVI